MNTAQRIEVLILIPAYNPSSIFLSYVLDLYKKIGTRIIIINDGSSNISVFEDLKKNNEFHIINNEQNKGKGAALKSGFDFVLRNNIKTDYIITADADGQHYIDDVINIIKNLKSSQTDIVLGCRNFDNSTPFKSRFGNKLTSHIFKFLTGKALTDTQTGLRAIPKDILRPLINLKGNRFEFELEVLLWATENNINFNEIPIRTIYFDNNKETNFRPIIDSLMVYKIFLIYFFRKFFIKTH